MFSHCQLAIYNIFTASALICHIEIDPKFTNDNWSKIYLRIYNFILAGFVSCVTQLSTYMNMFIGFVLLSLAYNLHADQMHVIQVCCVRS